MHEIGLCESVVDAVCRRAAGRPVERVRVRAGALLRVVEPSLQQAFELLATGTEAEGAQVELVTEPAELRCGDCGHRDRTTDALTVCPGCGGGGVAVTGGDQLLVESLTLRRAAGDPAAPKG